MNAPINSPQKPWMDLDPEKVRKGSEPERTESPAGSALVPASALNRRNFLAALGLGTVALAGCERRTVEYALPYTAPPEEITPGVSTHYASTCSACSAGCGLSVTVRDGRPIKLEGLPRDPRTAGGLCAVGQADVRALYDARRLRTPRIGGREASWREVDEKVRADLEGLKKSGRKLYLLSGTMTSPSGREAVRRFLEPFGGEHVEYDPLGDSAALEMSRVLYGGRGLPAMNIARADLFVCLGADPLGAGPDPVATANAWSSRRGPARANAPFRHVQIEGTLTLSGAAADERWPVSASAERLIALWLLKLVTAGSQREGAAEITKLLGSLPAPPVPMEKIGKLADSLLAHRGKSLVVSGADDPLEQAAAFLLNRYLENEGATVDPSRRSFVRAGRDAALREILDGLDSDKVGGVILFDCDPIDDLPDGNKAAASLRRAAVSIAITDRPTATANACNIVAAAHHGLEQWNDYIIEGGRLSLAQPTIRPLFDTRHPIENLLAWSGSKIIDAREYLRASWKEHVFGPGAEMVAVSPPPPEPKETTDAETKPETGAKAGAKTEETSEQPAEPAGPLPARLSWSRAAFESFWVNSVRSGAAPEGSKWLSEEPFSTETREAAGVFKELFEGAGDMVSKPGAIEVELFAEVALREGQRTFVPWLRELPDPLSRVSWEPCARIAPAKAKAFGIKDGDMLRVGVGDRVVELAARITPGQADGVIGVPVGYGRSDGDEGFEARNGYRLAMWDGGRRRRRGLLGSVARAGRTIELPLIQQSLDTQGRAYIHEVSSPSEKIEHIDHAAASMWPDRSPRGRKWEMVIDLDRCTGCSACVVACQAENNLPVVGPDEMQRHRDMHWLRIDRYFVGSAEDPGVLFEPMLCSQCANAPCETVCPVAATVHSHDGLNQQVYNRCVGTRYCANNCPYKVRRFNWFDHPIHEPVERLVLNPDVVVRERGVMEKCTFCAQRIQAARVSARKNGEASFEPQTACQQSCPTKAIHFGDGNAAESDVAKSKEEGRAFQVLAELGVAPSLTYLARIRPGAANKGGHR
ncbi:MAG: 4Fe-4S dicluster domain-containing protein [Polyangiaceae bacterium]|nr:4Fe-4S dicluster domain-containing protein [Polyangiaceae bacterium]